MLKRRLHNLKSQQVEKGQMVTHFHLLTVQPRQSIFSFHYATTFKVLSHFEIPDL